MIIGGWPVQDGGAVEQWLDGPSSSRLARNLSERSGGTERQDSGAGGQSGAPCALPQSSSLCGGNAALLPTLQP